LPKKSFKIGKSLHKYQTLIAVCVIAVLVAGLVYYVSVNPLVIPFANQQLNEGPAGSSGDTYNYFQTSPPSSPSAPSSSGLAPTSLYVVIEPNPVAVGSYVYGRVTGNGYLVPITIHAKLMGNGLEQSFGALLDEDGQYYHSQTLDVAGYYDFWATYNSVTSNKPRLTVQGITLAPSKTFVSKSFAPTLTLQVYSHMSGNVQVFLNDPAHSMSIPLTNMVVNSLGYGDILLDFSSISNGNYELDVLFSEGGAKASDYGSTVWIEVGR